MTFEFTPMVRFNYSFPNVDQKTRTQIYKVIFDMGIQTYRGGGGNGGNNSGTKYISVDEVDGLRQRLAALGLTEVVDLFEHPHPEKEYKNPSRSCPE